MASPATVVTLLAAVLMLASACGGGGGGGNEIPEEESSPPVVIEGGGGGGGGGRTNLRAWGLQAIRADQAYTNLAGTEGPGVQPGKEAVVGILDSGIDESHPIFAGKDLTEIFLGGATNEDGRTRTSHGTAVASVAAGGRDPGATDWLHGVAWGADLVVHAIELGEPSSGLYVPVTLAKLDSGDGEAAQHFRAVLNWRNTDGDPIDFLNLSFGYYGIIDNYSTADLESNFDETIGVLKQQDRAGNSLDKTILVWAAGNAHGRRCASATPNCGNGRINAVSPEVLTGMMARITDLQGHSIAVVAIGRNGRITSFSNRCGIAADWCIAAPGEDIRGAYFGPHPDDASKPANEKRALRGTGTYRGTSLAAPMVTGGLAVMKHRFRGQLTNTALVTRLFATANGTGIYANSAVYGHGLMDIGAATQPVGMTLFTLGRTVQDGGSPMQVSHVGLGGALGDGLAHEFAGHEIAAFDELGAPFWFDLGDFASLPSSPAVEERLRGFMAPAPGEHPLGTWPHALTPRPDASSPNHRHGNSNRLQLGFLSTPSGAEPGLLGLADRAMTLSLRGSDALTVTAFSSLGVDGLEPVLGGALAWRPNGSRLGLRTGFLSEREAMLGTSAQGAFGRLTANAAFAGLERQAQLRSWRVAAATELGVVRARPEAGLFTGLSPLTTSAFALGATRPLGADTSFRLSLSQPLRVEAGHATLSVPSGRTRQGAVVRRALRAGLAPSGRQLDVAARWSWRPRARGELRLGAAWSHEPGHRAGADPTLTLLGGWRHAF